MTEHRDAKAEAKAAKARAKAMRPWFKKKRFILGGLLVLVVIGAAAGGGGDTDNSGSNLSANGSGENETASQPATEETTQATTASVNYPGKQEKDHVAGPDGSVQFTGFTTTVKNVRRVPSNSQFQDDEICGDVTMLNRDTSSQEYNQYDWKLQTPSGDVKSFQITNSTLGSGALVNGATKTGTVCFTDPGESGQYIVIWEPDVFNDDRGIWLVNL